MLKFLTWLTRSRKPSLDPRETGYVQCSVCSVLFRYDTIEEHHSLKHR